MDSIIRPVKVKNFISKGIVMREQTVPGSDKPQALSEGTYGLTKMPGSFQGKRVYWDDEKRRWDLDIDEKSLQKLVKNSALRYVDGRKEGDMIEEANLRDGLDPFFTHPEFNLFLEEGSVNTSTNNSIEKIILESFKNRDEVISPNEKGPKYRGIIAEYEIVDKDYDKKIKNEETERKFDTIDLLKNSDFTKKSKIATIMKVKFDKDLTEKDLNTLLLQILEVSSDKAETFRNLCKLGKDDFELKYLTHKAMSIGVIKRSPSKNQYMFNGDVQVGRTIDLVEQFFTEAENFAFLEELQEYVDKSG
jgi:hypothetical protein